MIFKKGSETPSGTIDKTETIPAGGTKNVTSKVPVSSPKLWSIEKPKLYYVQTEILKGSASYYNAIYRQMSIMKDMGINTIRITHNPGAEIFIDICNELGLLVIEEFFDGWAWKKNGNTYDFSAYFNEHIGDGNQIIGRSASMTWAEFTLKSIAVKLIDWTEDVDTAHPVTSRSNRRSLNAPNATNATSMNQTVYERGGVSVFGGKEYLPGQNV